MFSRARRPPPPLITLNQRWEQARQQCNPVGRREGSKSASPREGLVDRTVPAELTNKVVRAREAVSAVQKQLSLCAHWE